jgi:hypothetical protein
MSAFEAPKHISFMGSQQTAWTHFLALQTGRGLCSIVCIGTNTLSGQEEHRAESMWPLLGPGAINAASYYAWLTVGKGEGPDR